MLVETNQFRRGLACVGSRSSCGLLAAAICGALALSWFIAGTAQADYEQAPEYFGVGGESQQLYRARAMAVNVAGSSGVEVGSAAVVGVSSRVLRFSPGAEGGAQGFGEAWGVGRCSPVGPLLRQLPYPYP